MRGLVCPNNEVPISVLYQHSVLLLVKFFSLLIQLVFILLIKNYLKIDRFAVQETLLQYSLHINKKKH